MFNSSKINMDLSEDDIWSLIESYFTEQHLTRCVRHQLESYDYFTSHQIRETINMFNPVTIHSEQDYDPEQDKYLLEIIISFNNFHIYRPQIHENNGATKTYVSSRSKIIEILLILQAMTYGY